jgi:hypothetical protein
MMVTTCFGAFLLANVGLCSSRGRTDATPRFNGERSRNIVRVANFGTFSRQMSLLTEHFNN